MIIPPAVIAAGAIAHIAEAIKRDAVREHVIIPEAALEPDTQAIFAYGIEAARKTREQLQEDTKQGWRIYARVD